MAYSIDNDNFMESLGLNVTGKKSNSGVEKTANFLKRLYGFDENNPSFTAFKYFWKISEPNERPLIAFVYAVNQDQLLAESVQVLQNVKPGAKVSTSFFEEEIEKYHPNQYAENTRKSMAQNLASSWNRLDLLKVK